jgi:hypothetical protein
MGNYVVLEDDSRIERQINMYIKEMDEEAKVRFFPSNELFDAKYCFEKKETEEANAEENPEAPKAAKKDEKTSDEELFQLLSSVDVIIFKSQCIKEEVRGWVSKTLKALKNNKFATDQKPTRFIVTKYEDDGIDKDYFVHPLIEDIIFLPMDRLIFLQKLEIICNLPRKVKPSFLFQMPVEQPIEISKKTLVERASDMGLAIRNPFRLAPGTISHLYVKFPGQKDTLSIFARALYSEPHPEAPNQFLVHHTYIGADSKMQTALKKFLTAQPNYRELDNDNRDAFKFRPPIDPKRAARVPDKTVAILDVETSTADTIADMIQSEMDKTRVIKEASLYFFAKKYIEKEQSLGVPGTRDDLYAPAVAFCVNLTTQKITEVITKPGPKDALIGHNAQAMFNRPTGWQTPFNHADAKALLEEAFTLAKAGQRFSQNIIVQDANSVLKILQITVTQNKDKETGKIELGLPEVKKREEAKKISALDLLIVNQALVPDNIDDWKQRIREVCTKNGVTVPENDLPVLIIADEKTGAGPKKYRYQRIFGMIYKPLKSRAVCYQVSTGLNWPYTKFNHANVPPVKCVIPAHVAIESKLSTIGEFGGAFSHAKAFSAGTVVYLHESIFTNAPDGYLCARIYFAEPDPKDKQRFLCYLNYFGISDQFLKFIRNWIRKDFAGKKQSKG